MSRLAALLVAVFMSVPLVTSAGPVVKYSKQALEQAQDAGKPIIVFVTASWCPNCRAQQPIVETLTKDPAFSDAVLFVVDFDSDKQALRDLNVTMQSTLIAFKGKTERKRSTAVTDPEQIRTLFQSAL